MVDDTEVGPDGRGQQLDGNYVNLGLGLARFADPIEEDYELVVYTYFVKALLMSC